MVGTLGPGPDEAVVRELGALLGLAVAGCVHLRTSQASVWRLEAGLGPHVLHIHPAGLAPERVSLMQRARVLLAEAGLPAVAPSRTDEGKTLLVVDGHPIEVQAWVDHDRLIAYSWADVERLAGILGRLHDVLSADAVLASALAPRPSTFELAGQLAASIAKAGREPDPVAEVLAFGRAIDLSTRILEDPGRAIGLLVG